MQCKNLNVEAWKSCEEQSKQINLEKENKLLLLKKIIVETCTMLFAIFNTNK